MRWALTRIGGWANQLVSLHAGLFIGPLWIVSDSGAATFANPLYGLLDGEPVGAAVQQARLFTRSAGDPAWLAYRVYAHPHAHIVRCASTAGRKGGIMPLVKSIGPYEFRSTRGDAFEPPPIHVRRERLEAKFWLTPTVRLARAGCFRMHELNGIARLVEEKRQELYWSTG